MDSYEIVERAVRFKRPVRIPFEFERIGYTDFFNVGRTSSVKKLSALEEVDEWGCRWEKMLEDKTMGQCVGHPLADWNNLKEYKFPDPDKKEGYSHIKNDLERSGNKFVRVEINGILRRARFLRGFSNIMMDFHLNPKEAHELLERLLDHDLKLLANYSRFEGIHSISMAEDWGTQYASFTSIPMFRKFFKSIYKKLFEAVHSYGWIFRMHSDGMINDIIEEWIDCGLDVVELEQPQALGIEEIGRRFRGRICFEGSSDSQATLPKKDRELIRKEARALWDNWATDSGGFIAVCGHGPDIGVPDEVIRMAFEAFEEVGGKYE